VRAVVLESADATPQLADRELPPPAPEAGEVVLGVRAVGVCHHDVLIATGVLRRRVRLPRVLGHEIAGVVEQLGDGVDRDWLGATAAVVPGALGHARDGGFAELVAVPTASLVRVPDGVPLPSAALAACPAGVALKAVADVGRVAAGDVVLVTGVSGGLGHYASQAAHALGARVLGVTTSASKVNVLEALGWLDAVLLDDGAVPLPEVVRALTDDRGADVVVDTVGGAGVDAGVRSLSMGGRLVLLGQIGRETATLPVAEAVFREAQVCWAAWESSVATSSRCWR
jgi:NADPH:quinone reductase-like Zn-dependent oxidoreductase